MIDDKKKKGFHVSWIFFAKFAPCMPSERAKSTKEAIMTTEKLRKKQKNADFLHGGRFLAEDK